MNDLFTVSLGWFLIIRQHRKESSTLLLSKVPQNCGISFEFSSLSQRYTYRVLQTIQMKLILLCVWAELAVLGSTKNALKFKYEI